MKLLLKVLLWGGWSCQIALAALNSYGYQSGAFGTQADDDHDVSNSYASSMYYDPVSKTAYVIGSTYWSYWDRIMHNEEQIQNLSELDESDCFLAVLSVPSGKDTMSLDYSRRFGKRGVSEACTALSVVPSSGGKTRVITSGHTGEGGFLTTFRKLGTPFSAVYGFLLEIDIEDDSLFGTLHGGSLLNDHSVQYPIAIATGDQEAYYVVSLSSNIDTVNPLFSTLDPRPDTAAGGAAGPEYGSHYSAFIKKIVPKTNDQILYEKTEAGEFSLTIDEGGLKETVRSGWNRLISPKISLDNISMEHFLQIADLKYLPLVKEDADPDGLVLVGTTTGYGEAFGSNLNEDEAADESFRNKAGFVTLLDLDGKIEAAVRIEADDADVVIRGVCFDQTASSVQSVYVVGETTGLLDDDMKVQDLSTTSDGSPSKHAFLTKIDISGLSIKWTRQLGGSIGKDIIAEGCAVAPGNDVVYMAGTVFDGDKIRFGTNVTSSAGGDDVFVANYIAEDGKTRFVKQIGSSKDDWLAKGNGIVTDDIGNALLLGNTKGSVMRWRGDEDKNNLPTLDGRTSSSDIFLFNLDKSSGFMKEIATKDSGPEMRDENDPTSGFSASMIFALLFFAVAGVLGSFLFKKELMQKIDAMADDYRTRNVVNSLDQFNDNASYEVHIRNNSTGGVHAVYGNKNGPPKAKRSPSVDSDISEAERDAWNISGRRQRTSRHILPSDVSIDSNISFGSSMFSEDLSLDLRTIT